MNKRIIKHKKLNEAFEEFSYRQRISDDDEIKSVKELNQMMGKLRSEAHKYGVDIDEIDGQTGLDGTFTYVFSLIGSKENMEKFLRGSKIYQDFLGINSDDPQDIEDELREMNKRARKITVEESLTEDSDRIDIKNYTPDPFKGDDKIINVNDVVSVYVRYIRPDLDAFNNFLTTNFPEAVKNHETTDATVSDAGGIELQANNKDLLSDIKRKYMTSGKITGRFEKGYGRSYELVIPKEDVKKFYADVVIYYKHPDYHSTDKDFTKLRFSNKDSFVDAVMQRSKSVLQRFSTDIVYNKPTVMQIILQSGLNSDGFDVKIVDAATGETILNQNMRYGWNVSYDKSWATGQKPYVTNLINDLKKRYSVEEVEVVPGRYVFSGNDMGDKEVQEFKDTYLSKTESLTEASARIKVPEPYNKYYKVDTSEHGATDFGQGEEIEGNKGIHFLANLTIKSRYEDSDLPYDAILTDDPDYPVCDLAGGRLYPIELPKTLKESTIEQPERMRTAEVGDTIIYKGDKIKLKRKEFIYSEVDRKKIPVFIGEVNGKERKYFPADIDYMLKTPGTLKEAFDTSSQYEYDDLVADMFGNMSDAELDKQLRDLKRYAKHLGLKKPDDMVVIRLEGDDEYTYDPANYYRGTHLNDNVVLYDDFDTELVSLVRELINGNVWLYFANSGDAETYTTEIDRINLVDETEADSIDDFDLEDEGE